LASAVEIDIVGREAKGIHGNNDRMRLRRGIVVDTGVGAKQTFELTGQASEPAERDAL
jgi:hypothetical protein